MKSKTSKILHNLAGKKVIEYVLDSVKKLNPFQIVVVTSPELASCEVFKPYSIAIQKTPLGTAHAVQVGLDLINEKCEDLLILCGDTPCLTIDTLESLNSSSKDLNVTGMLLSNEQLSMPYGRFIYDDKKNIQKNVEYKDASREERFIPLANAGVYKVNKSLLTQALTFVKAENSSEELYLTDIIEWFYKCNYSIDMILANYYEAHGINTRQDLIKAEEILQTSWKNKLLDYGVTLRDPNTTFLSCDTLIGEDTEVGPFVTFGPGVIIGKNVKILPFCHIEYAHIQDSASIGPFAHIRGHTTINSKASIGNFVEVKGSNIGQESKAKHLSYIGDTDIGEKTNIGAGTITCNYDGVNKHKTVIGSYTRIGANTSLIAPIEIGNNVIVGAGSTLTQNVQDNALALARSLQIIKNNYNKKNANKR